MDIWTPLFVVALMTAANLVRKFAPAAHFLHTPAGLWIIATGAGAIDVVAEAAKGGGFHLAIIVPALVTFLTSALAGSNPSIASNGTSKVPGAGALALLLGCGLMFGSLGCAALQKCELGKLPAALQTVVATVEQIALDTTTTVADLEAAALQFAPGQVDCALQALATLWGPAPKGEMTPAMAHARALVAIYQEKHPAVACGPRQMIGYRRAAATLMYGRDQRLLLGELLGFSDASLPALQ